MKDFTVADIREDIAPFAGEGGKCKDSTEVLKRLNDARRFLWKLGNWQGTESHDCAIIGNDNVIAIPTHVSSWKKLYTLNRGFDFAEGSWGSLSCAPTGSAIRSDCSDGILPQGRFPTYTDPTETPFRIKLVPEREEDEGKQLTFVVFDEYGTKQHHNIVLSEAHEPYTVDARLTAKILTCVKPLTVGRVRVIALYNDDTETALGDYTPYDLNPSILRVRLPSVLAGQSAYIFGKLKYFDLREESELVEFDTDALIAAMQALKARRAGDTERFTAEMAVARSVMLAEESSQKPFLGSPIKFAGFNPQQPIFQ
ncbi:MAG: hypothetical protein JW388_0959 [Nitrospira sp.]|nr:hypothetical protein [Nitrospira sp.]